MKKTSIIILCIFISLSLIAQKKTKTDANLTGHTVDETGEHIPFVNINIKGTTIGGATDATGHYFLKNLPEGKHIVKAQSIGYEPVELEIELENGKTKELNFTLKENSVELNDVVVSANRTETNRKEAPIIVGIVSQKLFELTNSSNIGQGLSFQPGLRVENNCQNCGFQQVRINGLEGPYTQILIDSKPVFSSLAGVYGIEQLPANMVDRVEVTRGGGSALFGSNAIGGTVNIITKEPTYNSFQISNTFSLLPEGSPDNVLSMNTSLVTDNHKAGIYLYGMMRDRNGWDTDDDGYTELGKLNSETVGFRSFFRPSEYNKVTLEYHRIHEYRRGGDSLDIPPHQANIAEQIESNIDGGGISYLQFSKNYKHTFNAYASAQNIVRRTYYGAGQDPNAYGKTNNLTIVGGAQYSYRANKFLFMPAQVTAGIEYTYDDLKDKMLGYHRNMNQTTHVIGVYAQNEWKSEKLSILIGGRLDKHNLIDKPIFSPRINLRYNPASDINLRASYSSGYLAPQAFSEDMHITAVGGSVSIISLMDGLRPEYSNSFSASADYTFTIGEILTNVLVEGFFTMLNDVFVNEIRGYNADSSIINIEKINGDGAKVRGLNFEVKLMPMRELQLQAGFTLQKSTYNKPTEWSDNPNIEPVTKMFRSPDRYGYFTALYNPIKRLSTSLTGVYTGPMIVQHLAGYIPEDIAVTTSDFFDLSAKVSYDIKINGSFTLQVNAGVQNIFNSFQKDFDKGPDRDAGYIYGPTLPRTFFVGLKFGVF